MSFDPQQELSTSAYDEVRVSEDDPITQISASYGLLNLTLTVLDSGASGSNTVVNDLFNCQTGVAADGLASILSLRQLAARSGQGILARIDAIFSVGKADSIQAAGLITAENSYAFGLVGTAFGIIHAHGGVSEEQELTITVAAAGAETATINIDGNPFSVPLTAGTVQHNAFEIANSLQAQVVNYNFTSNDDQVVAQSLLDGPQGAFSFSSTGTAVAAWVQEHAGVSSIIEFFAQSAWNVDTRLTGVAPRLLNPFKGNLYQIQINSNFGAVSFFIEDSDTGSFVLVHQIREANLNTLPNVTNQTFRLGWFVNNTGNTTNLTVSGNAAGGFIEGKLKRSTPPRAEDQNQLAVGTTLTNIITFRNRIHFGGKVNRVEIIPILATLSSQTNKSAFFEIRFEPTFGGDLDFFYIDKANSVMEIATDAVTVSGGTLIAAITVVAGSSELLEFNLREALELVQFPGGVFSIAARVSSGAAADMQATGTWAEGL